MIRPFSTSGMRKPARRGPAHAIWKAEVSSDVALPVALIIIAACLCGYLIGSSRQSETGLVLLVFALWAPVVAWNPILGAAAGAFIQLSQVANFWLSGTPLAQVYLANLTITSCSIAVRVIARPSWHRRIIPSDWLLLGIAVPVTLHAVFSQDIARMDSPWNSLKPLAFYLVIVVVVERMAQIRLLAGTALVAGFVTAVVALLQYFAYGQEMSNLASFAGPPTLGVTTAGLGNSEIEGSIRVSSTGEINSTAAFLVACIGLVLPIAAASHRRWIRWSSFPLVILLVLGPILMVSRTGLFSLAVTMLASLLLVRRSAMLSVVTMAALLAFMMLLPSGAWLQERFSYLFIQSGSSVSLDPVDALGRLDLWLGGFELWANSPFVGLGPYTLVLSTAIVSVPHNIFLEVLLSLGLLGFIPWLVFVGWRVHAVWQIALGAKTDIMQPYAAGVLLALLALFTSGLFMDSAFTYTVWFFLAMSQVIARQDVVEAIVPE